MTSPSVRPSWRLIPRVLSGLYALAALGFAAIWVHEIVAIFDPDFNEDRTLDRGEVVGQALVGFLGVSCVLVASGSALAYATTTARRWLTRMSGATLCAVLLFAFWVFAFALPAVSS